MHNPLHKRFPRQFLSHAAKYLAIFLMLVVTISIMSGFLVVTTSVERLVQESAETYHIEDGRFETDSVLSDKDIEEIEDLGVSILPNFSHDLTTSVGKAQATVRVYGPRESLNQPALFEGRLPESVQEIAIDDTFAHNYGLSVGDQITLSQRSYKITGIIILPDYMALFKNNNDVLMDNLTFAVALVSEDEFAALADEVVSYTYSFTFNDKTLSLPDRIESEFDIAKLLVDQGYSVTQLLDAEQNNGISYADNDVVGDQEFYRVMLMLLVSIMAFIFVILTSSSIEAESAVIGTLLASGYTKAELIRHYVFLPAFVGCSACVIGNLLAYGVLVDPLKNFYYTSYSLPPFQMFFNWNAFVITTLVPLGLLIGITLVGLVIKLRCTPLQFLRHDIAHRKGSSLTLPTSLSYKNRFRMRFIARNKSTVFIMFVGIFLSSVLLTSAFVLMPCVENYANNAIKAFPAEHIYTLKAPYELQMTEQQQEIRDQIDQYSDLPTAFEALRDAGSNLKEGSHTFASGLSDASQGVELLRSGIDGSLSSGVDALGSGSSEFASKLAEMSSQQHADAQSISIESKQNGYAQALKQYMTIYTVKLSQGIDPTTDGEVQQAYGALAQSLYELVSAAGIKGGKEGAATALEQVLSAYAPLHAGTGELSEGMQSLSSGVDGLQLGMTILSDGYTELSEGINTYIDGVNKLLDTAEQTQDESSLEEFAQRVHPVAEQNKFSQAVIDQTEKIAVGTLQIKRVMGGDYETVTVYGIQEGSQYWQDIDVSDGKIVVGSGLAHKSDIPEGSTGVFFDKFQDKKYALDIASTYNVETDTNVYMSLDTYNEVFEHDSTWFNGYVSNDELSIDSEYLINDITPDEMLKFSHQMMRSMGKIMVYMGGLAVFIFFIVMYLLVKTVIERSARSISYMKVFGYRDREVNALYVRSITSTVVLSLILSFPLVFLVLRTLIEVSFSRYSGYIVLVMPMWAIVLNFVIGLMTYILVVLLEIRHIRKIPLSIALKHQE